MTLFLRVLEAADKATALKDSISMGASTYEVDPASFAQVPGSPFAYWVSEKIRRLFQNLPPFEGDGRTVKQGLATADDFRFARSWWEVPHLGLGGKWIPFAKGGSYSPFYSDVLLTLNWDPGQYEMWAAVNPSNGKPYANVWMLRETVSSFFLRPGITFLRRSSRLCMRALPKDVVFSDGAQAAFTLDADLPVALSLFLSSSADSLVKLRVGNTQGAQFMPGMIGSVPYPAIHGTAEAQLASLPKKAWSLVRLLDSASEISHAFSLPSILLPSLGEFSPSAVKTELARLQTEIDDICFKLYGIEGEDRRQIEEWAKRGSGQQSVVSGQQSVGSEQQEVDSGQLSVGSEEQGSEDDGEEEGAASADELSSLFSWCVGVAFGRFDIRLATGERQPPPDPEPFDPLPKRSPGMVPEGDPVFRPGSSIFVDDPGHTDDLMACVRSVLERVSMPVPDNLRQWLARDFFPLHIRMYSKSRRKAPIYWQLSTPSGSYSVWVYIHAFTRDTLFRVQNDYIAPKLEHEMRRLYSMRSGMTSAAKASEHKALATQEAFVQELKDLLAELRLVTPLWEPELDDGVVINAAPLWRLFPQNKAWQKELRSIWDSLCAGKYDWSHMAMHLWPERVVPRCATDRSLAIAHGLEDVFWAEGADGKWAKMPEPGTPLEELIQKRESSAVKDSLASLLAAPAAGTGQTGRRGRSKGNQGS